ncbi:MAG TPA: DUF1501 domain-containing protein [Verrucomicrobiae bacterium]|nr:DUF1501 domain-containing protein [Verrucomicrobiae bacterium]
MQHFNILTRRDFLSYASKAGIAAAISSLADIPLVAKRALAADSSLGRNGKKVLFIFLRGANDGLNSVLPVEDPAYYTSRPGIGLPKDTATNYASLGAADNPVNAAPADPTFSYPYAIRLGNGFAALHPSLKFLAPVYNAGDLALVHRVGYPKQSRSHFDSQNYWENGTPNNNVAKDGIFYRTVIESGLAHSNALTGVSFQSSLPLILRGSEAAMTNLSDPNRYSLLGVPNTAAGNLKADNALRVGNALEFPWKRNRDLLSLQYKNMTDTMSIFASLDFNGTFTDDINTDGDTAPYNLFPTTNAQNGGYALHNNAVNKYVVPTGAYGFFEDLKAAALVLNKTDAIIAGTQLDGFDTHSNQVTAGSPHLGSHANLQRTIGWSIYALKKYFSKYADKATWNNLVIVTLSEFGRTTIENSDSGTDHAEASVMFVAGGAVKGYNKGNANAVFGVSPTDKVPWVPGPAAGGGSMFGASQRYLKRAVDYRSLLGKVIRDHLGASQQQLDRIIPGYTVPTEFLKTGGLSTKDATQIMGELPIV